MTEKEILAAQQHDLQMVRAHLLDSIEKEAQPHLGENMHHLVDAFIAVCKEERDVAQRANSSSDPV